MRLEVTMGRISLLGLTLLMVLALYGLAFSMPGGAPLPKAVDENKNHEEAVSQKTLEKVSLQSRLETSSSSAEDETPEAEIVAETARELRSAFKKHDFYLSSCKGSRCLQVPRLDLASLPSDLKSLSPKQKKDLFLRSHLPLVLKANEAILEERASLEEIMSRVEAEGRKALTPVDKAWIKSMMDKYRLKKWNLEELLKRIDVLPPSLALGQSAVESGWGTSFAAREKNSTFGMTVRNKVLGYTTLQECVDSYIRNINANPAYKELREIRARLREEGTKFCGIALAEGLIRYSELGRRYIKKVQTIIRSNNLKQFDTAQLIGPLSSDSSSEEA